MKVFYWVADTSGCGYYRCVLPGTELARQGHAVMVDAGMPPVVKDGGCDVIVAQRTCNEGASATWQEMARRADRPLMVFETDDDLTTVDPSNHAARDFYTADVLARYLDNIRVADLVTTTTEALADRLSEINPNVVVLPNQVPGWLLDHERPTGDPVTLGWRGGSSHARDFGEIAKPLRRFLQQPANRGRVVFHSMGVDQTPRVASNHSHVRHTGWQDSVADFLSLVDFDVSVIPLRPSVFNDGKSDLAVVEMSALGIPVIATGTGPYADTDAPILRANTPTEWTAALRGLVEDEEARTARGKQAREWAADRTIEANAHRWTDAYTEAMR